MKKFSHEVIFCIVNAGFTEAVMDAAREVGATGGTVKINSGTAGATASNSAIYYNVSTSITAAPATARNTNPKAITKTST